MPNEYYITKVEAGYHESSLQRKVWEKRKMSANKKYKIQYEIIKLLLKFHEYNRVQVYVKII